MSMPANEAMAVAGLARLEGRGMVERWGFEDPACGKKRSLQHWSEKKRKKEKKHILLMCLQIRQWQWWDLQGLRGEAWWRGGGLRTWHVGKRGLCNTGQKRNEKEEKKHILLMCPQMRQWQWWDLWGLRGEVWWRGGGLRTQHVGKRGLCNGQKWNEKRRKKT